MTIRSAAHLPMLRGSSNSFVYANCSSAQGVNSDTFLKRTQGMQMEATIRMTGHKQLANMLARKHACNGSQ